MTQDAWASRPLPAAHVDASVLGRWAPTTPAEATAHRRRLSALLHDGARPAGADEGAVQRLLLVFEELVSNALRHGRGRVQVTVSATATGWLLEVVDAAGDTAPVPAIDRDAALGGLGLYLVARLSSAHGWTPIEAGRKVVWAHVDGSRPATVPEDAAACRRGN
jgi:anti-sigma regulatory factor (Ser/Thr protein kinase)